MKASCSSFTCKSADGKHFLGRTYDEYGDISTNKVALLQKINPVDEPETQMELPCHYLISDKTGESVVVEPLADGLKVYRNEMGVLTNAPTYEWHKINLRNYLGISNLAKEPQVVNGYEIEELGEGTGYLGIPGDYTPVSRFVRLAFSKNYMPEPQNEIDAVSKMFNIFETVDVPEGVIYTPPTRTPYHEKTLCTSVMCSESLKYYFSTSTNCRICCVDLQKSLSNNSNELLNIDIPFEQDILTLN